MSPNDGNLEGFFTLESGGNVVPDDAPFHMLFLGDWSGSSEKAELGKRKPIEVDRDNFDDVFRKIRPEVLLEFDGENSLKLSFSELDDFHPDNIFRQIPLFENLRDIRKKLKNAETFNEAAREVRTWFAEPEVAQTTEKKEVAVIEEGNLLDAILGGSSVEASAVKRKTTGSAELSDFIGRVVKPHIIQTDLVEQANLVRAVDEVSSDLMRKILHHKAFMALESAWRGLYFTVRRTDTDSDLKIFILNISKDELADDLKSVKSLKETEYFNWIRGEKLETLLGEPWSVVLGNYDFAPNVDDIASLMRIGQISGSINTSFLSHIRPEVLGVKSISQNPKASDWNLSEETNEYKLWETLRGQKEAEFLGMAMPRLLGRLPYGFDTEPTEVFGFEELSDEYPHEDYLWINPVFACGYLLAKSFRKNGWEMAENIAREIDGLPMHVHKVDGETNVKPCAEIVMTEAGCQKMVDTGVMPFVSFRDSDRVRVASFQSISSTGERIRGRWY